MHNSDLEDNQIIFNNLKLPCRSEREEEKLVIVWILLSDYVMVWEGILAAQGH